MSTPEDGQERMIAFADQVNTINNGSMLVGATGTQEFVQRLIGLREANRQLVSQVEELKLAYTALDIVRDMSADDLSATGEGITDTRTRDPRLHRGAAELHKHAADIRPNQEDETEFHDHTGKMLELLAMNADLITRLGGASMADLKEIRKKRQDVKKTGSGIRQAASDIRYIHPQ